MSGEICSVRTEYRSSAEAFRCLDEIVKKEQKPHKIVTSFFVSGDYEQRSWHVTRDDYCRAGAEYKAWHFEDNELSARSCARALSILEGKEYQAVRIQYNLFRQSFYKVVEKQ